MNLHPFNPTAQRIQTSAKRVAVLHGFVAHLVWDNPVAANASRILNDQATSSAQATEVTAFLAQPDVARQISITPGGTTADVAAGNITIVGTDEAGNAINEQVAIAADASAAVLTTRAFKTITSITFPKQDGAGATYDVGITDKLGIPYQLERDTMVAAYLNNVREATMPTVTKNAADWTKNLIDLNSALNGSRVDVFLIV